MQLIMYFKVLANSWHRQMYNFSNDQKLVWNQRWWYQWQTFWVKLFSFFCQSVFNWRLYIRVQLLQAFASRLLFSSYASIQPVILSKKSEKHNAWRFSDLRFRSMVVRKGTVSDQNCLNVCLTNNRFTDKRLMHLSLTRRELIEFVALLFFTDCLLVLLTWPEDAGSWKSPSRRGQSCSKSALNFYAHESQFDLLGKRANIFPTEMPHALWDEEDDDSGSDVFFILAVVCVSTLSREGLKEKTGREIDRSAEIDCEARRVRKKFIRDGDGRRRKKKRRVCRTHTSLPFLPFFFPYVSYKRREADIWCSLLLTAVSVPSQPDKTHIFRSRDSIHFFSCLSP